MMDTNALGMIETKGLVAAIEAAAAAFTDGYGQVSRADLLRACNRLSSAIYLLMIRQRAARNEGTP